MRPWLLRPPWLCCPSVSPLTGFPFHSSERSIRTVPRRLAVTGLNCLSAILVRCHLPGALCEAGGEIDRLAGCQSHDGLLEIRAYARASLEALGLAFLDQRVHRQDFDVEQGLDRRGDLRLGSV